MSKLSRYTFYILGAGFITTIFTLIFPANKIISPIMMVNIALCSITISIILTMVSLEKKQHKAKGKLSRYLLYITTTIAMTGFILVVNKIANGKIILKIGIIGFAMSAILTFINAIRERKATN